MAEAADMRAALRALWSALDAFGQPAMLIGGLAVAANGHRRGTLDIDATLMLDLDAADSLLRHLETGGFVSREPDPIGFARKSRVLLLIHENSGVPVDLSLGALPFEAEAIRHSEALDVGGVQVRVPRLEDLLIYKLVAGRPRDLDDVEQLLRRNPRHLDLARVDRTISEFCAVLEDETRLQAWDALKTKLGRQTG